MREAGEGVSEQVQDQALVTVECDVPVGWSLDDWRRVRGLAQEVIEEPPKPWWRRLPRASRRSREEVALR
jgi:hypothetical protein